jgi:glycosyltransferase involved in cell wall biosynthesis
MKIAVVADWLTNQGGAENVVLDIMETYPDADLYTSIYNEKALPQFLKYKPITSFIDYLPFAKTKHQLYLWLMPFVFESFDFSEYDIVISSSFACSKGIITKPNTLHICYCHTPMRYVWGRYIDFIKRYKLPTIIKSLAKPLLHKLRIWDYLAAQRVDVFIANSSYIQKRIKKFYKKDSIVLNPAIEEPIKGAESFEFSNYYLCIGRLTSHKRFDLIIKAFNENKLNLVVAGKGDVLSDLKNLNSNENTKFVGFVSKAQRAWLYKNAKALIFPQEEDFGITPVEAQSYGCSVIAYNKGGIKDSVTNKTATLFNKQTAEEINQAIKEHSKKSLDKQEIKKHAESFYNKNFRKKLKKIIEQEYDTHKKIYS